MNEHASPPAARSRLWQQINQAAAEGLFKLQVCAACKHVQYPPQEFCSQCLADDLAWENVNPLGKVLSWTTIHASTNQFFKGVLPFHVGLIKLDCGPVMVAYLAASCLQTGSIVQVTGRPDRSGQTVFVAPPPGSDPLREFSNILTKEVKHDPSQ